MNAFKESDIQQIIKNVDFLKNKFDYDFFKDIVNFYFVIKYGKGLINPNIFSKDVEVLDTGSSIKTWIKNIHLDESYDPNIDLIDLYTWYNFFNSNMVHVIRLMFIGNVYYDLFTWEYDKHILSIYYQSNRMITICIEDISDMKDMCDEIVYRISLETFKELVSIIKAR